MVCFARILNEAYEAAFDRREDSLAVVCGPVVTHYRDASQNLRTTFEKIVKRAGLNIWPKPFQNLRAMQETEPMETYPAHVVFSWIGHSDKVARRHYLQTSDAHFEKAIKVGGEGHRQGHKASKLAETASPEKEQTTTKPSVLRGSASAFATNSYPVGTRTPTDSARNCCATNYTTE